MGRAARYLQRNGPRFKEGLKKIRLTPVLFSASSSFDSRITLALAPLSRALLRSARPSGQSECMLGVGEGLIRQFLDCIRSRNQILSSAADVRHQR